MSAKITTAYKKITPKGVNIIKRKDREITNPDKINQIIKACDCCRLGLCDNDGAYIVPLNFGFTQTGGDRIFYFHMAKTGKKTDLIEKNQNAGFELDTNHALKRAQTACGHSFSYSSIIGKGKLSFVDTKQEKLFALSLIMQKYTNRDDWSFEDAALENVAVLKLTVTQISAKECR